jgi:dTDP-4-amino-4,6-dideoxy-D-galactose acyltransferase
MDYLPVEYLEWDSVFFSKRIARITTRSMSDKDVKAILDWASKERIDCLYYLAGGQEKDATVTAEDHGFHFVDLRVTHIKDLTKPEKEFIPQWHIHHAEEKDLQILKSMAREAFQLSRFHADKHFDQIKADELYEVWIENDLHTKGHDVWVISVDGQLAAYTSVCVITETKAQIGLVGTQAQWRGKGLSLELQRFISHELRDEGIEELEVVTQGRNIPALRLYQRAGYFIQSIDLWYHKWFR